MWIRSLTALSAAALFTAACNSTPRGVESTRRDRVRLLPRSAPAAYPLPSWNAGRSKTAITRTSSRP